MLFSLRVYVHEERLGWLFVQDGDSHTGAWPPSAMGRGRGPPETSYPRQRMTQDTVGGYGRSEATGAPRPEAPIRDT